jgi:type VI protein secretion system component VasK
MTGIDYFTWFVLIIIAATLIVGFVVLAQLPGKMAAANNHPQAAAINMAGWLGLIFTVGIVWIIAMIWAQTEPTAAALPNKDVEALKTRIADLEGQLGSPTEVSS